MKVKYTAPEMKISNFEYKNILTTSAVRQAQAYLNTEYNDKPLTKVITLEKVGS
ncbi:MAG: hypothetical protein Q4G33_01880 [bacterium]|nr:hypothetical protein [bacterium]